ncbi:hypothetical protein J4429_02795 [Candidatus Pacearchaeota archaeon]|nr:hypothetical protein [Candidatus Pacearchaeota archaeon]
MSVINYIKDILKQGFRDLVRDVGEDINEVVSRRLNRFKKQIFREFIGLSFILMAIGFLSIALIFFLVEYLGFDKTLSFLIIGVIILIIGILIKLIK